MAEQHDVVFRGAGFQLRERRALPLFALFALIAAWELCSLLGVLPALFMPAPHAVLRALYGYLMGHELERIPHLHVPLHTVLEFAPKAYGAAEQKFALGPMLPAHSGSSS